jgi:hypothetical protein
MEDKVTVPKSRAVIDGAVEKGVTELVQFDISISVYKKVVGHALKAA